MKLRHTLAIAALGALVFGCVEHRPVRNGLRDESIYLDKTALTEAAEGRKDAWLFKVTVVEASSPNVVGDYAFPGFESDLKLVQFRFIEDQLQVLDARRLQGDDPDNPNDDAPTRTDRVMFSFDGEHVDVKLRESLDGERTNYLEENTEEPWQRRQKFKVDFEKTSLDPITNVAWFYGEFLHDCARQIDTSLVPDSYEFDEDDDHLSFVVEVNYLLNVDGYCYDMVSLASGVGTASIRYRFSFYRAPTSDYTPEVIAEKDEVNKKYGAFQILSLFRDSETGLLDAKSLLQRWNPNRTEPVVFYFHEGFPPRFKPMFEEIKAQTNKVLADAGASLNIDFREWNDGGIERHLGDIRYSFVVWHQDIDTTRGLLGYGPSSANPRTGEVISANLNLYNVGMDWYRFLIQDYLEEHGAATLAEALVNAGITDGGEHGWEDVPCTAGETVTPASRIGRLRTGLFTEMRRVMDLPEPEDVGVEDPTDIFLPTPLRPQFVDDYLRTLPELRYVRPEWNSFVYETGGMPLEHFADRLATEREFSGAMEDILMNGNPYGTTALHTLDGIEAQNDFSRKFREWRRNHDDLQADREYLLGRENIYVFNAADAIGAVASGARKCAANGHFESDSEYSERIIEDVVFHVAIHEFGHNLGLRHNFYGSVDAKHLEENELSASVMDYVRSNFEAGTARVWGGYDKAALTWIYGGDKERAEVMQQDFLYCTDEHRYRSPMCTAHDLGITPSQIVLNAIEQYDWLYSIRNRRAFRKFWDTSGYVYSVYDGLFPLMRMWYLAIFDWGGGGVQDVLKRLDQVDPNRTVLTDQEYDEISLDFYNDVSAAVDMTMAFYDAIINQPASLRNYQTEFDPYYGDVIRLGIIIDKLYAAYAFMDQQDVYNYNPNVSTYVAMWDAPFGSRNAALAQRVMDNMLGANYDIFPWFRYTALNIFAWATNTNLLNTISLRDRIAIRRYDNRMEFEEDFGRDVLGEALRVDNPTQIFVHDGEQYVYTFLPDQGWHLVAGRSRNPVSYQFIKDYNEDVNAGAGGDVDNYGLKILLAYYEYYTNFVGF